MSFCFSFSVKLISSDLRFFLFLEVRVRCFIKIVFANLVYLIPENIIDDLNRPRWVGFCSKIWAISTRKNVKKNLAQIYTILGQASTCLNFFHSSSTTFSISSSKRAWKIVSDPWFWEKSGFPKYLWLKWE